MQIDRTVELDIDRDELWRLIASPFPDVLGDLVVERGIVRQVRVDEVVEGESIAFTWWEEGDPLSVSHVRLTIDDGGLQIVEQHAKVEDQAAWEVRVCSLWAVSVAAALLV